MTREEVNKLIIDIKYKVDNGVVLTDFEDLVLDAIELAMKENRELSIREIEDYQFWMV